MSPRVQGLGNARLRRRLPVKASGVISDILEALDHMLEEMGSDFMHGMTCASIICLIWSHWHHGRHSEWAITEILNFTSIAWCQGLVLQK